MYKQNYPQTFFFSRVGFPTSNFLKQYSARFFAFKSDFLFFLCSFLSSHCSLPPREGMGMSTARQNSRRLPMLWQQPCEWCLHSLTQVHLHIYLLLSLLWFDEFHIFMIFCIITWDFLTVHFSSFIDQRNMSTVLSESKGPHKNWKRNLYSIWKYLDSDEHRNNEILLNWPQKYISTTACKMITQKKP